LMCGVIGVICGYLAGTFWPNWMSASNPGPMFMMACAIAAAFGVSYIAHRGVTGSTSVNIAINVIQITALLIFSAMALNYRMSHPPGSVALNYDSQTTTAFPYQFATEKQTVNGQQTDVISRDAMGNPKPLVDASGKPVPFTIAYPEKDDKGNFQSHPTGGSVIGIHNFGWMFVQATIAILILVGFESVTSMGGEAKNAKRDIPIAVITSLLIQGVFCYLIEYFCAIYFLNSGYPMSAAAGSAAPIGDMMIMVGDALFGQGNGKIFMLIEAFTVFLALIGTTLSCINTGARVTYAMGKDAELPDHFGKLHESNLTPHRSIWTLAAISAVVGCLTMFNYFGDAAALSDATLKALPQGFWSSFGYFSHDTAAALPNSFLAVSLSSNFGTFLLYMLSCIICIVGYHNHPNFKPVRHLFIPLFGLLANLACMAAYLVLPFMGIGTKLEPFTALGVAAIWLIYGGIYFMRANRATGRTTMVERKARPALG
jgi:basic amino acid/polyamine antiporter, APA family